MPRTKSIYVQDGVNWPPDWFFIEGGRTLCGSSLTGHTRVVPGDIVVGPLGERRVGSVLFPLEPHDLFFASLVQ